MNKYDAIMYSENTVCENLSKTEPAKMILEEMDAILNELEHQLIGIDSAIYSPRPSGTAEERKNDPANECLLGTLDRQRTTAKKSLDLAIHIREGLW